MKILVLLTAYLCVAYSKVFNDAKGLTKDYAIVLVSRAGCGHCKNLKYFDEASEKNAKVDFVKLDSRGKNFDANIAALNLTKAPHLRATPMFYMLKREGGKLAALKDSVGTGNIGQKGLDTLLQSAK